MNCMNFTDVEIYTMMHKVEVDITEKCDLKCTACSRSSWQAPSNRYMTIDQITGFLDESVHLNWKWEWIALLGGEPTLHPDFLDIIDMMVEYKKHNPECIIKLKTNGADEAMKVLPDVPSCIQVINSHASKAANDAGHEIPFNVAPIDVGEWDEQNIIPCRYPWFCGMGLTRDGYFPCASTGGIYRVFNLTNTIKSLKDVTFEALDEMFLLSCKYCGAYLEADDRLKKYDIHTVTESWRKAYEEYNR